MELIERQAAIDALDGSLIVDGKEHAERVMEYLKGINARIKALPTREAIPVDWIESYLSGCAEGSIAYYVIKQMLYKWREENG